MTCLSHNLKQARERAGLSQFELAKKLETSSALISQYETGHRTPTLERLYVLASALGTTASEILEGCP